jgi:hypothetical protein
MIPLFEKEGSGEISRRSYVYDPPVNISPMVRLFSSIFPFPQSVPVLCWFFCHFYINFCAQLVILSFPLFSYLPNFLTSHLRFPSSVLSFAISPFLTTVGLAPVGFRNSF